ncbi:hypothetical protein Vadar_033574 [Vaccinium darrowii]|uniref:Uncharacterized protein n=1 Tax=Vaccinium darrowii TaxID=229202 RepID=A0ACB7X637_9ERIC|nr:hypothetical protein Vadar_033574 [Vaccinium darrowii]
MDWKSRLQEITNSKPLFLTIYALKSHGAPKEDQPWPNVPRRPFLSHHCDHRQSVPTPLPQPVLCLVHGGVHYGVIRRGPQPCSTPP